MELNEEEDYGTIEPNHPLYATEFDIARIIQRKADKQNIQPQDMKVFIKKELNNMNPNLSQATLTRMTTILNPDSVKKGGRRTNKEPTC